MPPQWRECAILSAHGSAESGTGKRAKSTATGKGTEESERAVVLAKRGNSPGGPRGGKGVPGYGTAGGKDRGDPGPQQRLNGLQSEPVILVDPGIS